MLDSTTQGTNLQGGQDSSVIDAQVPQTSSGDSLQQSSQQDVLTNPTLSISVPEPSSGVVPNTEMSSGSTSGMDPLTSFMIVGVFTSAVLLIVLLAKLAKPTTEHVNQANAVPDATNSKNDALVGPEGGNNTSKKSKKRLTRRQRRQLETR